MSIIVANLQDNRAVFRIFITLLRFSFHTPSYSMRGHILKFRLQKVCNFQDNNFPSVTAHAELQS